MHRMKQHGGVWWAGSSILATFVFVMMSCTSNSSQTGDEVIAPSQSAQDLVFGLSLPEGTNAVISIDDFSALAGTASGTSARRAQGAGIVLDSAWIVLREIVLKLPEEESDDGDDDQIKLVGPFVVDLLASTVENLGASNINNDADGDGVKDLLDDDDDDDGVPDGQDDDDDGDGVPDEADQDVDQTRIFDALTLPEGVYRRIRFRMAPLDAEDLGLEDHFLDGLSALVTGTIGGVAFEYSTRIRENFDIESKVGIQVVNGEIATFLVTLDVAGWFAGEDIAQATMGDGGIVVINDNGENRDLANQIRALIKSTSEFGHDDLEGDAHGNGDSDSDDEGDDSSSDSASQANGNENDNGADSTSDDEFGNENDNGSDSTSDDAGLQNENDNGNDSEDSGSDEDGEFGNENENENDNTNDNGNDNSNENQNMNDNDNQNENGV